jgi:LacI family transcriptional regulator/LacI family repressor for deo operon, udp, cdd, tsx, nupC, and nupG
MSGRIILSDASVEQPARHAKISPKTPTISDVASLAGVAKSTVSAVLNHKDTIKDSTRRNVLRAIDELHYRPSRSAQRGFRHVPQRSLSFIIKEAANTYYAEVFAGIQEVAAERGYLVFVSSSEGQYEVEHRIVEQCMEREIDGVLIAPVRHEDTDLSHIFELKRQSIPFVLLERVQGVPASLVDVDNVKGSADAVRYLIEQGHSRIVHFAGPEYSEHSRSRAEGVRRAFSHSHLKFDDSMLVPCGDSHEQGYQTGLQYFGAKKKNRPTAVTCYNDLAALGLIAALRELRIDVPNDVSVIGFDDLKLLELFPQKLTTVRVPKFEMGRRAAEMLIRDIESKAKVTPEKVLLETRLMIRETTRAL